MSSSLPTAPSPRPQPPPSPDRYGFAFVLGLPAAFAGLLFFLTFSGGPTVLFFFLIFTSLTLAVFFTHVRLRPYFSPRHARENAPQPADAAVARDRAPLYGVIGQALSRDFLFIVQMALVSTAGLVLIAVWMNRRDWLAHPGP